MSGTASGVAAPSISSAISCARRGLGHRRLRHLAGNGRDLRYRPLLYHSRHPLLALECAASVCAGTLVAETVLDATDVARPAMVFYPGAVLKNDPSSWWGPNLPCVEAMLHEVCFEHIRFTPTPIPQKWTLLDRIKQNPEITPRGVFHASR